MLGKLRYKFKSRDYFHPEKSIEVVEGDFLKILQGEVFNPNFSGEDYLFMIVGVSENSPLNSWAGQQWGPNGYPNAHNGALWYGQFSCKSHSTIVVPERTRMVFNPFSKSVFSHYLIEASRGQPWLEPGFMDIKKDLFARTLVSSLDVEEVTRLYLPFYARYKSQPLFPSTNQ
ncbi:Uncharacterised protein [uncultured archaeon]|nr:Uncharacterised protein [uncultured archaeon]